MTEDTFHLGIKALIKDQSGNILILMADPAHLIGQTQGHWDLPGGRLQVGEDPVMALKREVAEETGITNMKVVRHMNMDLSKMRIPHSADSASTGLILSVYECTIPADASIKISEEHTHYAWVAPAEARDKLSYKFSQQFCDSI